MGASINKEKNKIVQELEDSPQMHIDARMSILADIGLSRDFSHTYLQAICKGHTGGKNEAAASVTMSLATVCESLAKQRVICYGAGALASAGIRKFTFPASNVVDAPTGMGIGGVFAQQLPVGAAVGSQIATQLNTMALTFMSGMQIGPPAAPPSHMGPLQELYSSLPPTSLEHAKELSNILDKWTKGWTVSGIYPPPSAAPFSGPLS